MDSRASRTRPGESLTQRTDKCCERKTRTKNDSGWFHSARMGHSARWNLKALGSKVSVNRLNSPGYPDTGVSAQLHGRCRPVGLLAGKNRESHRISDRRTRVRLTQLEGESGGSSTGRIAILGGLFNTHRAAAYRIRSLPGCTGVSIGRLCLARKAVQRTER